MFRESRFMRRLRLGLVLIVLCVAASVARAGFESWKIDEIYSNADGSRQFIVLKESSGSNGMNNLAGRTLTASHAGVTRTYTFGLDLPTTLTANASTCALCGES
jgi:hypothetical protein